MKALITDGKGNVEVAEMPLPEIGAYDCLVKMEACVFCNSTDRHLVHGSFPFHCAYPAVLGHESIGIVTGTGQKVKNFKVGDRVLRPYAVYPGDKLGGFDSAWGGFAEYGKICDGQAMLSNGVTEDKVPGYCGYQQVVPPEISLDDSLLLINQKEVYSSVQKFPEISGKSFLIAGTGIVGLLFGKILKSNGAAHVAIFGRRQSPVEFALKKNVADRGYISDQIAEIENFDYLVDAAGSMELAQILSQKINPGGAVLSYAVYTGVDYDKLPEYFSGIDFQRIDPAEAAAHEQVCGMVVKEHFDPAPFITHRFQFSEILEAWKAVDERRTLKTAVLFSKS